MIQWLKLKLNPIKINYEMQRNIFKSTNGIAEPVSECEKHSFVQINLNV